MKRLVILIVGLCLTLGLKAQQYEIYPTPQRQAILTGTADFTPRVCIVAEAGIDAATIDRAKQILSEHQLTPVVTTRPATGQSYVMLGLNGSKGVADKQATRIRLDRSVFSQKKYDRHVLSLTADNRGVADVVILGENTDAVFMGLASLEQILDNGSKNLRCVHIYDYADVRTRGIIEGYYGVPYTAEVTKDLFRFMARYKMNCYMYGAKSDPYHSRFWSEPYPTQITDEQLRIGYLTQDMLRDITNVAHATKVNFIWAIHPGTAFVNAERTDVIPQIMKKLESMYGLGVRQFGVFVDDVGVPSDAPTLKLGADRLAELQHSIDSRWNKSGTAPADTVKPLHYVPQLYAYSWVSRQQGRTFFEALSPVPAKVSIYITGANVWSVPNNYDLELVSSWLGRNTSWWWNYPCNDNDVTKLFTMDTYDNFRDERHINNLARLEPQLQGTDAVIINPMQQGEISKIALFSVADYTWNNRAFDNHRSYDAAIPAVVGREYADAFRAVAPCLRYFDADAFGYEVGNYKASVNEGHPRPGALTGLLNRIHASCEKLEGMRTSSNVSHQLFYEDMRPWLTKLKAMTQEAVQLMNGKDAETFDYENDPAFQFPILNGMGEDISLVVKTAEPSAQVLRPFIQWMRDQKAKASNSD